MKKIKSDVIDITITIPDNWTVIPKSSYEEYNIDKRTLFLIYTPQDKCISFMYQCRLREVDFDNLYIDNIDNLKKDGMEVLYEGALQTNGKLKQVKYAFVSMNVDGKNYRVMHNFFLYNDYFINVSSLVNPKINPDNILELMDDTDVIAMLKMILSIE